MVTEDSFFDERTIARNICIACVVLGYTFPNRETTIENTLSDSSYLMN